MNIKTDSRKIQPGDTFVALDGFSSNGSDYIGSAIQKGAAKIVCRKGTDVSAFSSAQVEWIFPDDPEALLEEMLVREYGETVSGMKLIAVTGTNGKTTTCYIVSRALCSLGIPCGYIGTIGFYLDRKVRALPNTSVALCDLYGLLLEAHEAGFDTVALEASSQGLDMGRLHTLKFDAAVFTNLTEEHLDYHLNMDNYAEAKKLLFKNLKEGGTAIVNRDDAYGSRFLLEENKNVTYGIGPYEGSGDLAVLEYSFSGGTEFTYSYEGTTYSVRTPLLGKHNLYNTISSIEIIHSLGVPLERINAALPLLQAPDGRCSVVVSRGRNIMVDYAHTPDGIENIMECAKGFTNGDIYVVFGCTGDRERQKRPIMTQYVLSHCTKAVLTVDDVHFEDTAQIFADMLKGNTCDNYVICEDRRKAIEIGFGYLKSTDTLMILGKGHEEFIIVGNDKIPHKDMNVVEELLAAEANE